MKEWAHPELHPGFFKGGTSACLYNESGTASAQIVFLFRCSSSFSCFAPPCHQNCPTGAFGRCINGSRDLEFRARVFVTRRCQTIASGS